MILNLYMPLKHDQNFKTNGSQVGLLWIEVLILEGEGLIERLLSRNRRLVFEMK